MLIKRAELNSVARKQVWTNFCSPERAIRDDVSNGWCTYAVCWLDLCCFSLWIMLVQMEWNEVDFPVILWTSGESGGKTEPQ